MGEIGAEKMVKALQQNIFTDCSKTVLLLRTIYVFSVLCLFCLSARLFICALWSPAGKELTSWLSFVASNCDFVTFPIGILDQVGNLIVSIPGLCTLIFVISQQGCKMHFMPKIS